MSQISILSGIYTDSAGDVRTSLPRNLMPVPKSSGVSTGYLRPADGIKSFGVGPGIDRGGINRDGSCYRVMGSKLVQVGADGAVTTLGDVGTGGQGTLDYSFDRLAIASGGSLYYWNGAALTQVTDPDLGTVIDMMWIDGYFMTTDGVNLVVTELADPTAVNPLKYGSAEVDPDPVKALLKLRDEAYALGRYTIEVFQNIGGSLFPFQRIPGAMVQRGVIGTHACAVYQEAIAFLGSGRDEAPSVYLSSNGSSVPIATREIDQILQGYTEAQLAQAVMEVRVDKAHQLLYIHLPDQCLVYDAAASKALGVAAWFTLASSLTALGAYRARNLVWCYDKWVTGDPTSANLGTLANDVSSHYGDVIGWEFGTAMLYNEGMGAIIHELELVCLPGRVALSADPVVWASYSTDGQTFSQEKPTSAGKQGQRDKRIAWRRQGHWRNYRIQKFRGNSDAHLSVMRLDAQIEPLGA